MDAIIVFPSHHDNESLRMKNADIDKKTTLLYSKVIEYNNKMDDEHLKDLWIAYLLLELQPLILN